MWFQSLFVLSLNVPPRAPPLRLTAASTSPDATASGASWVAALGGNIHGAAAGEAFYDAFASLASSADFVRDSFARKPLLIDSVAGVANSFTLDDLREAVDGDFLDAGRGIPDVGAPGGWKMAPVSEPRGPSFEDAKMRYVDVADAMRKGTVVFNSAGAHIAPLGTMCLAALDAFDVPNCLNLYVTAKGTTTSAPPHTDKQDVFVMQSCGAKRWRVYEPPAPAKKPAADPLARGKAADNLDLSELSEPLIDTVLTPGQVLYVPAGWPHTTDTINTADAGEAAADDSVHLTIGLDTHIWGLNYAAMRAGALARAKLPDAVNVHTLPADDYWQLMGVPPSVGFLSRHQEIGSDVDAGIVDELVRCARLAEPSRWADAADDDLIETLDARAISGQVARHAKAVVDVQRAMYLDAARDVRPSTPGMPRVSIFRVKEHMACLESAMEGHLQWYGDEALRRVEAAAMGAAAPPTGGAAKSGFGGMGGGAKAKAKSKGGKGAKGKGKKKK